MATQPVTPEPSEPVVSGADDFSDISGLEGTSDEVVTVEGAEHASAVSTPPELATPAEHVAPAAVPAAPGGETAAAPVATHAAPADQPAAPAPVTPSTVEQPAAGGLTTEQVKQRRQAWHGAIAARYTLTEADKAAILTEPEKFWPNKIASVVLDTHDAILNTLVTHVLPGLVQGQLETKTRADMATEQFFQRWPGLNKPEYGERLIRIATAYRRLNPTVPVAQLIEEVGAQAHMALGVPYETQVAAPAASSAAPRVPAQPIPFRPAAPGASRSAPAVPVAGVEQPWDDLVADQLANS